MSRPLELSVVVPTFNERDNIVELFRRLEKTLAGIEFEIIVVDDDSADGTADVVRELAREDRSIRVLQRVDRRGLSSACVDGMMSAAAPYIAVIDADLQHDETQLPAMLSLAKRDGLDLVAATRFGEGSMGEFAEPRVKLSKAGKKLSRFISRTELSDPMSGFFLVDRRFLDEVVRSVSGVGFKILLDMVASAQRPVRFAEVPYRFGQRVRGESKLDVLAGVEYLQLVIDKLVGDLIPPRFVMFGLVGASGVIFHLAILGLLLQWGHTTFAMSQLIATVLVMTSNFFLNNVLTWRDHRLRGAAMFAGLLKFYVACSIGAFVNVRIASFALAQGAPWYVAGLAGLLVGSVWNFAVTAATTWRRRRRRVTRPGV